MQLPIWCKIIDKTALPKNEPFVFFDTDTIITDRLNADDFDFNHPLTSMRLTDTWPKIDLYDQAISIPGNHFTTCLGWIFTVHWVWPNLTNTGNAICISTQVGFL